MHRPVETAEVPEVRASQSAPRRPFRLRSYHVSAGVFVVAVAALLVYAFYPTLTGAAGEDERPAVERSATSAARVETVNVAPRDFLIHAEATGYLAPWRVTEVSAEASGRVVERRVEEGRFVQVGSVLVRLDDRDRTIEVQEAEAELLSARAVYAVNTSRGIEGTAVDTAAVAASRARLLEAEAAFARGDVDRQAVVEARRRFEAQLVLSGQERSAVQAVTAGLAQAEQRLERARLALSRMAVQSPFAGRIADLQVETGQHVSPGQPLLTLIDDSRMKVEVDVLESDLVRVREGGAAVVRVPSMGNVAFRGTIFAINPRIDNRSGTGRVTVAVSNPQGRLISGIFAYVELETDRLADRLVVPADAVLVRQGRDLVFRVNNGRAEWVYVEVGRRSGNEVEIVDGLKPGDEIAIAGHHALAHDAPVAVMGQ
jgi:RND family efflux transporter MFP subunit